MVNYARTDADGEALALQLTDIDREEPIIVIATHVLPAAIEPKVLQNRTSAAVHVLLGYDAMNALSGALPPGTAAYSRPEEACIRVYPAGMDWIDAPQNSRYEIVKQGTNYRGITLPRIVQAVDNARVEYSEGYEHDTEPVAGLQIGGALSDELRRSLEELAMQAHGSHTLHQASIVPSPTPPSAPNAIPAPAEPQAMAAEMQSQIDALQKMVDGLRTELETSRSEQKKAQKSLEACRCDDITEAGSTAAAIRQAETRQAEAERKYERADAKVRRLNDQLTKNKEFSSTIKWLDAHCMAEEEVVRILIDRCWNENYLSDDQNAYPLKGFEIQPSFFRTISGMHDADRKKIIHVMTDIVSYRAETRDRSIHPYRQGEGSEEPSVMDSELGTLMRINLENNTAAAKRLHFWKGNGGKITFHSALRHDDKVTWPAQKSK